MTYQLTINLDPKQAPSFVHIPLFDGILYGLFVREKLGDNFIQKTHYEEQDLYPNTDLPLNRYENGIFKASQAFFEVEKHSTTAINQHWNGSAEHLADFGKRNRAVDKSRGVYKSNRTSFLRVHIDKLFFYFDTDNVVEVISLLEKHFIGVGKKNNIGWGTVLSWEIEQSDKDFDKELLRPLPVAFMPHLTTEHKIQKTAMRCQPPYFLKQDFQICRKPLQE